MEMTITLEQELAQKRALIDRFLDSEIAIGFPSNLFDSMHYIMTLKGKRLRPLLVLMIAEGFGVSADKAICAGMALEVFHNSTLIHDDIMDQATLRRGATAVHKKFGMDKAIITGDAMLPHSVGLLIKNNEDKSSPLIKSFLTMAQGVMEGQQLDMEFEKREDVSVDDYMEMIKLKTSVLFGCACEIGAILGGASKEDQKRLYDFGLYNGIAFQIMDDYLDTFGDASFGKRIGGDILLNKKTYLLINALKNANQEQKKALDLLLTEKDEDKKISGCRSLFKEIGVKKMALDKMEELNTQSIEAMKASSLSENSKEKMTAFSELILRRTK